MTTRTPVKLYRGGAAHVAMAHLAENGPTRDADLRAVMAEGSESPSAETTAGQTLRRLEVAGLVKTKMWLTPEGLEELKRLGMLQRAGVAQADAAQDEETTA